jgi:hypothetical protein
MCLIRVVANNYISWLQVTMNVALRVYALQPIHELQSYDDDSLNLELALLERFFKFFQVDAEELHY